MSTDNKYHIDFADLYCGDQVWLEDKPMVVIEKIPAGSDIPQGGKTITTQVHMVRVVPRNRAKSNPDCAIVVSIDRLRTRSKSMIIQLGPQDFESIFDVINNSSVEITDWEPVHFNRRDFHPTDAPPGSSEKIEVLRRRLERGQPLWHADDRVDYLGLTGIVRPRE
ncbi:MAG: hypothetical protein U0930_04955 [Pirellulales bacterium]